MSWGPRQLSARSIYDETGEESKDLGLPKQEYFMVPSRLLLVMYGTPLLVRPANERQRRLHEEEISWLPREGTLSREEEEYYKKKEDAWDYDNNCLAEIDAEGNTQVGALSTTLQMPKDIIPATPRGLRDSIYISSSLTEVDTIIGGIEKTAEGLGVSKHTLVMEPQRIEVEEEAEIKKDEGMESNSEAKKGEIKMFPQKAKMAVDTLAIFIKSTRMEEEDKKGPRRRLAKAEEVIWALGRVMDQKEKGIPRGWEEAEEGLDEEEREYLQEVKREWGSQRDKLIDK